ncbi:hypothetical protein G3R49_11765 [Shewanella sp. WXL01]|uniref:Uncharacterized protein n=1 Tax=Shewanella maritima TaxID=2520507 RepID=A0A411PJ33_9GAMM|nr:MULTISPECIES: hypothetical protein [Shewanella]NKF51231.1 hypothetical protein [Shewanella sp. WXL01]QBF83545.1 hypothetical protein EXU30_13220 [Shewanella maritima]
MNQVAYQLNERRDTSFTNEEFWELTTADQKVALYDLHRFGYRLLFVRQTRKGPLAVVKQQEDIAVIHADGEVDLRPKITIREH